MEAPNKLFIKPKQIKVEMIPGGELPNVGIQYIRKDALLEWLNQRKKLMEEEIGFGLSIDNVIDKLNSM